MLVTCPYLQLDKFMRKLGDFETSNSTHGRNDLSMNQGDLKRG